MKLTMADVIDLARQAGIPDESLAIAGAIAKAESGLNTEAVNVNGPTSGCPNGSRDLGLWQINDCYHKMANPFDPIANAAAMAQISNHGKTWKPWSTFNNGSYRRFLAEAEAAAGVPSTSIVKTILEGLALGALVTWAWEKRAAIARWFKR